MSTIKEVLLFAGLVKELLFQREGSAAVILSLIFPTSLTFKHSFKIIIELQKAGC